MSLFEQNTEVLRDLEASGADLGSPRFVDFSHIFPSQAAARAFAQKAEEQGFSTIIAEVDEAEDPWDVTASKTMIPTCENITAAEERLDALARLHQGRADGWGFFRP